ncbi:MAG: 16S rRNA (guanine(966)-N(2))-methyltransferase RsmD [Pseudobdellovibrionaceae bacterium]|jgi:16S rRNA (guanine966-N2)-methyltransferase|nr:16S rRNA (guanine(966)-N(2))-methyltransferase RsmD [Pseudobdellovibrionaceae bacterium]
MRIIGGSCRGRPLKTPKNQDIRPTTDKVRQAIFNALYSRGSVVDMNVLDAFCGTGALGLEALSHGAARVTFADISRTSLGLAKENARDLGVDDRASFLSGDSSKLRMRQDKDRPFDLVFLDPPYRKGLVATTFHALDQGNWLTPSAWIVIEAEKEADLSDMGQPDFDKAYGDTRIIFVQK